MGKRIYDTLYKILLSDHTREKSEQVIIFIAILAFILHLLAILLSKIPFFGITASAKLLGDPIAAIYTPFSFILIYEVYLLVYYLPHSMTIYIGKQYEIISLIVIRRIFKDLSELEFTEDWFRVQDDLQFTYDLTATVLLFLLIFIFYRLNQQRVRHELPKGEPSEEITSFIHKKNILAMGLVPVIMVLLVYSFGDWFHVHFISVSELAGSIRDINKIFFNEFFTILILADVILLLLSFSHTDRFSTVIRNSGFIISTILIRLSFSTSGLLNTLLILVAVVFGVLILAIHNQYEKVNTPEDT